MWAGRGRANRPYLVSIYPARRYLTAHISHLTAHISHLTANILQLTAHSSQLISPISHLTAQISQLTAHISHLTAHNKLCKTSPESNDGKSQLNGPGLDSRLLTVSHNLYRGQLPRHLDCYR